MKFNEVHIQSHRTFWGLLVGVALAIFLIFWMRNDVLATILGTMVTILVTRPQKLREFASLGGVVGVITGPATGVQQYLFSGEPPTTVALPSLLLAIFTGVLIHGCLCAVYGFLMGLFLQLYKKGQGPFF